MVVIRTDVSNVVPVVIVGGGAAGLNMSIFLSNYSIPHVLFEKHPGTSILPKAHYINQRTMEIFRQHGLAEAVSKVACPSENMSRVEFRTSLGGDGPFDGKLLGYIDAFGGGETVGTPYRQDSPIMPTNIPLLRSEPIFRQIAEEKNPGRILFSHTVTEFVDEDDSVVVTVQTPESTTIQYRCQYMVAADAGKLSHKKLGIEMEGLQNLACMASTHFKADLSKYHNGQALITHFMSPSSTTLSAYSGGALVPMGPTWGPGSEEWSLHFGFPADSPVPQDPEFLASRIKELLNIPTLDIEVIQASTWIFDRVVASKFRVGRTFIIGDAAHRIPPAGGLGMNTAIEDALNLATKLALCISGSASPQLLDTYEPERRPIALRNADWGLFCLSNFPILQAAVGLQPGNPAWNGMRMAQLFAPTPAGAAALHAVRRILSTQDIEFQARNLEMGFRYDEDGDTMIVKEGSKTKMDEVDPTGRTYVPTTIPGGRLPHAWLSKGTTKISTLDLLQPPADFVLITDEQGAAWADAVRHVEATLKPVKISVAVVTTYDYVAVDGFSENVWRDVDRKWTQVKGVGRGGAVLVRGDNIVAWRSDEVSNVDSQQVLEKALMNLCRINKEVNGVSEEVVDVTIVANGVCGEVDEVSGQVKGVGKEVNGTSEVVNEVNKKVNGTSEEMKGVSKEMNGVSVEENGVSGGINGV